MEAEYLTLTYARLREDVDYLVEASSDLQTWSATGVDQGEASASTATARTPLEGDRKFLRLKVSKR